MTTQVSRDMTDLREKIEDVLREAHRRGRKSGRSRDTTPYTFCDLNDAIMALVQPVVTRDDVIEELAVEADEFDLELGVEAELHGVDQKTPLLGIADWLRSHKGG